MLISSVIWDWLAAASPGLTAIERWSAARSDNPDFVSEYGIVLFAGVVLVLLVVLLWQVTLRRDRESEAVHHETFSDRAAEWGLNARERQILLAVAARSGLRQNHEIFDTAEAFYRGGQKLLGECGASRTPAENEALRAEVDRLREKLDFQPLDGKTRATASDEPSTRSIRVGKMLGLVRRRDPQGPRVQGDVVRNDDLEVAVEQHNGVATESGEVRRARSGVGVPVRECDTSVVSSDQTRPAFNQSADARFVDRRRFPRMAVSVPALVARFPFVGRHAAPPDVSKGDASVEIAPEFVSGAATQLAGPGVLLTTSLRVRPGERILVVLQMVENAGRDGLDAAQQWVVVQHMGEVKRVRGAGDQTTVALELVGLADAEIDELMRLMSLNSVTVDPGRERAAASGSSSDGAMTAPAAHAGRGD